MKRQAGRHAGMPARYERRAQFWCAGPDVQVQTRAVVLYLTHTMLELVLGWMKVFKGSYSGLDDIGDMPLGAEKFARHHGIALLSLALLSGLVLARGLTKSETGEVCSLVLAFFHVGAVAIMVHALNLKVVALHVPFALGFGWDSPSALATTTSPTTRPRLQDGAVVHRALDGDVSVARTVSSLFQAPFAMP